MAGWWLLALGAGLASAVNVGASKLLVTRQLRPLPIGGAVHLWGGLLAALFLPFVERSVTLTPATLLGLALMGGIYTLGNALYFLALDHTQLSEIDLFLRTSSLWTLLGGVVLLAEPLSPSGALGAVLILGSVFLLSGQQAPLRFSRAQLLALGAAVSFGAGNVIDKQLSGFFDPLSYTVLNLLLTGMGMLALARVRPRDLRLRALWGAGAWLVAATFALTQLLIILAFAAGGSAGGVILIAQVRLVLLMAAGTIALREIDRLGRKLAAASLMLGGIALLALVQP